MTKAAGPLVLLLLVAACGGESRKLCVTHLEIRLPDQSPLGDADRALVRIESRGTPTLREVDLAGAGSGTRITVPDTNDIPPSDSFRLTFAAHDQNDTITAIGRTGRFGCLGQADQRIPLYIGPAGGFAPVDTGVSSRDRASGSALGSGQVLIFGGSDGSALLYQHGPGTICAPGESGCILSNPPTSRIHHTATILEDGRVLLVGGRNPANDAVLTEATLYHPASGSFSKLADLTPRYRHAAVLLTGVNLADKFAGRVLVVGGLDDSDLALNSADLIDVSNGTFETYSMNVQRYDASASMLGSGEVLVAGGYDDLGGPLDSVELFESNDGGTEAFLPSGGSCPGASSNLCAKRAGHTATLIGDNQVLLWGGQVETAAGAGGPPPAFEVFWGEGLYGLPARAAQGLTDAWAGHTATLLEDGRVLLVGGDGPAGLFRPEGKSGDEYQGDFTVFSQAPAGRVHHLAVPLEDGSLFLFGGTSSGPTASVFSPCEEIGDLSCPGL